MNRNSQLGHGLSGLEGSFVRIVLPLQPRQVHQFVLATATALWASASDD